MAGVDEATGSFAQSLGRFLEEGNLNRQRLLGQLVAQREEEAAQNRLLGRRAQVQDILGTAGTPAERNAALDFTAQPPEAQQERSRILGQVSPTRPGGVAETVRPQGVTLGGALQAPQTQMAQDLLARGGTKAEELVKTKEEEKRKTVAAKPAKAPAPARIAPLETVLNQARTRELSEFSKKFPRKAIPAPELVRARALASLAALPENVEKYPDLRGVAGLIQTFRQVSAAQGEAAAREALASARPEVLSERYGPLGVQVADAVVKVQRGGLFGGEPSFRVIDVRPE